MTSSVASQRRREYHQVLVKRTRRPYNRVYLENPDILHRLAGEKLDDAAEKLRAEGWSWVEIATERDWGYLNRCEELDPHPLDVPPELAEQKARLDKEYEAAEQAYHDEDGEDEELAA